ADPPDDCVHHPGPSRPAPRARILEERDVRAGAADLIGVKEVVDGRVVLVDRLLDEPEPEHARVVLDVLRRVARDAGDVVDAFELHRFSMFPRVQRFNVPTSFRPEGGGTLYGTSIRDELPGCVAGP